jgi:hypothetical protein
VGVIVAEYRAPTGHKVLMQPTGTHFVAHRPQRHREIVLRGERAWMIRPQYLSAQLERGLVSLGGRVRVAVGIEINSEIVGGRERVGMLGTKNSASGGERLLVQPTRLREPSA